MRKFKRAARDDGAREGAEDAFWGAGMMRKLLMCGVFVDVVLVLLLLRDDEDV